MFEMYFNIHWKHFYMKLTKLKANFLSLKYQKLSENRGGKQKIPEVYLIYSEGIFCEDDKGFH